MRFVLPVLLFASPAFAQNRIAERTPPLKQPVEHTMQRAGNPTRVAWWAVPSVGRHDAVGYVGGATLKGNSPLLKGTRATGPADDGTFGSDFAGFKNRMGRVFLGPSADPSRGSNISRHYRADGPHVPDVFALRPLRKAVLEKKEDQEHGHEK